MAIGPSCSPKRAFGLAVVAAVLVIAVVLLVVLIPRSENSDAPQVTVEGGTLQGQWLQAATGERYAAFMGVRYALPPVGKLRFKAPRKASSWTGIQDATKEGSGCLQGVGGSLYIGSEDCLFLNVYSPKLPEAGKNEELLSVFFLVHGGKFQVGSSSRSNAGADFFVHEGVVVVSINYRLGLFGYLSLDNEELPGNAGVKDQIAALKWVYRNIARFGGDPNRITVGGESAGAASAHWLSLLPPTQGLIQRVILMSGSAFHNWAYSEEFLSVAQRLGGILKNTTRHLSTEELEEVFMQTPADELNKAGVDMSLVYEKESKPDVPFCPTPERRKDGKEPLVVTRDSESYFLDNAVPPVPIIIGVTNREWMYYALVNYGWGEDLGDMQDSVKNLNRRLIPKNLIPYEATRKILGLPDPEGDIDSLYKDIVEKVRAQYFTPDSDDTCNFECKVLKYCDHIFMVADTSRFTEFMARRALSSAPIYLYRFSVHTEYNDRKWGNVRVPADILTSAVHGDISKYVYHYSSINQDYFGNNTASLTLRRMTRMFSNFVKGGDPVPQTDQELSVKWNPNNNSVRPELSLLHVGDTLSMRQEQLTSGFVKFWSDLYLQYRQKTS